MIRGLLRLLGKQLRAYTMYGNAGPYLTRHKLLELAGIDVNLHRFHRGDEDEELHSHPWEWAVAIILSGGYIEWRFDKATGIAWPVRRKPGSIYVLRHDDYHRVDLESEESWSLFITGPKTPSSSWEFFHVRTRKKTPWREFIKNKGLRPLEN